VKKETDDICLARFRVKISHFLATKSCNLFTILILFLSDFKINFVFIYFFSSQLQQDESSQPPPGARRQRNNSTNKNTNGLKLSFLCLVVSAFLLIFLFGAYTDSFHPIIDGIAGRLGYHDKVYAVVMDAGSTGSRVLAFEFHRGYLGGCHHTMIFNI
jgi:hypothetical protein